MRSRFLIAILLAFPLHSHAADTTEADLLYKAGKWKEAAEAYGALASTLKGADKVNALYRMGRSMGRLQKAERLKAIGVFRQIVEMKDAPAHLRSASQLRIGYLHHYFRHEEAVAALKKVADIEGADPRHIAEALLYMGWNLGSSGKDEESIKAMLEVTRVEKGSPLHSASAYLSIGTIREKQGKTSEAISAYKKVLELKGIGWKRKADAKGRIEELQFALAGDIGFFIDPFISHVTQTTARLAWVSLKKAGLGEVTLEGGDQRLTLKPMTKPVAAKHTEQLQEAALTHLKPGLECSYIVKCAGKERKGTFRTAPLKTIPFQFAVLGDTQDRPTVAAAVAKALAADNPELVLHLGDLVGRGSRWGHWKIQYFDPAKPYLKFAPVYPTLGNHDGGPYFGSLFALRPFYFTFSYSNFDFFVLQSQGSGAVGSSARKKQLDWFRQALEKSEGDWKLVIFHEPMYYGKLVEWPQWGIDDFLPLMEAYEVDLVMSGHDHVYRRFYPIGEPGRSPLLHIISGGGGGFTGGTLQTRPTPVAVHGGSIGKNHHCFFKVDGNQLEMVAKTPDGTELDRFTLIKTDGKLQAELLEQALTRDSMQQLNTLYGDFKHPDYNRGDILGEILDPILPGSTLRVRVKTGMFSKGITLVFSQAEKNPWKVTTQRMGGGTSHAEFRVTVPGNAALVSNGVKPRLAFKFHIEMGGRRFEPLTLPVTLTQKNVQTLIEKSGEKPRLPMKWDFRTDPAKEGLAKGWHKEGPLKGWGKMSVAAHWSEQLDKEFNGDAWYRTRFDKPELKEGERLWLEFGSVDESCWVYVNGKQVAGQLYNSKIDDDAWQKPRRFDVTDYVVKGQNLLAVKVQSLVGIGGIAGGADLVARPVSLVTNGDFLHGNQGWNLPNVVRVELDRDNGKYVEDGALMIKAQKDASVRLSLKRPLNLKAGNYRVTVRFRQAPTGAIKKKNESPLTLKVVSKEKPLALLGSAGGAVSEWSELSASFRVTVEEAGKPSGMEIVARGPWTIWVDEVSVVKE
ncbi:MAG: metallophosphoesterase [Planctomycetota bacterium]|nr:metallophosphoesterase [Planctomycetota bacterium]